MTIHHRQPPRKDEPSISLYLIYDGLSSRGENKMSRTRQTGARGERLARNYLIRQGYTILDTNWSTSFGELDIVAQFKGMYVFVEVKTRRSRDTESALAGVTAAKHDRIIKAVYQYLHDKQLDEDAGWRIDVIGIALGHSQAPVIDHVEDAFDW